MLGAILIVAAFMRLVRLSGTSGDLDEGIRGIQLLLMSAGYRPMQEIYSSQGPLLLDMLYPVLPAVRRDAGGGPARRRGLLAARASSASTAAARAIGGPVGGAAAALLLTLSPNYLRNSRQALAEVPALAPAILAVAAAFEYQRSGRRRLAGGLRAAARAWRCWSSRSWRRRSCRWRWRRCSGHAISLRPVMLVGLVPRRWSSPS